MFKLIESYGNMSAKEMLTGAVESLNENLKYFEKMIK